MIFRYFMRMRRVASRSQRARPTRSRFKSRLFKGLMTSNRFARFSVEVIRCQVTMYRLFNLHSPVVNNIMMVTYQGSAYISFTDKNRCAQGGSTIIMSCLSIKTNAHKEICLCQGSTKVIITQVMVKWSTIFHVAMLRKFKYRARYNNVLIRFISSVPSSTRISARVRRCVLMKREIRWASCTYQVSITSFLRFDLIRMGAFVKGRMLAIFIRLKGLYVSIAR